MRFPWPRPPPPASALDLVVHPGHGAADSLQPLLRVDRVVVEPEFGLLVCVGNGGGDMAGLLAGEPRRFDAYASARLELYL